MIDVYRNQYIRCQLPCQYTAAKTTYFFMRCNGIHAADVFRTTSFGNQSSDFSGNEATQTIVKVGAEEGIRTEAALDRSVQQDRITGLQSKTLDLICLVLAMNLQVQIQGIRTNTFVTGTLRRIREMNGTHRFDRATVQGTILTWLFRVFAEYGYFVTDQGTRQERITVDPDLAVAADLAHLHADLVSVTDQHDAETIIFTRMGIPNDTRIADKLMHLPALRHEGVEVWLQHTNGHG